MRPNPLKSRSTRKRRLAATATAVAVAAGGAVAATVVPSSAQAASACAPVHIIVARASTELPGEGIIGSLASEIKSKAKVKVTDAAVNYPALLFPYDISTTQGDTAIKQQLTNQVQQCPDQKIVLMGYSQGAQLVGDVLAGGGGALGLGAASAPVPSSVSSHVVAVIQMGDPRHMPNLSFDKGTAVGATGLFPRGKNQSLEPFADKIQSYCDNGDPFCARGANVLAHLDYTLKYNNAATQFVLGKIGG